MNSRKEKRISHEQTRTLRTTDKISKLKFVLLVWFVANILLLFSCSGQRLPVQEISFERDGTTITSIKAEIARTDEERNKGLMFRKTLKDGEGMLFVYEMDDTLSFWMKNTLIPLSIAFITSEGRITEIKDMYPGDLKTVTSSRSVRFALEAPQGWFARASVQTGDIARIEKIDYNK